MMSRYQIIDYIEEHQLYDEASIKALRIQVVRATRMVDLLVIRCLTRC